MNTNLVKQSEKPDEVVLAVKLLLASLLIGIIRISLECRIPLEWQSTQHSSIIWLILLFLVFVSSLMLWLIYKINSRKNWARITWLILFVLGLPFSIKPLILSLTLNPFSGILGIGQCAIQIIAMVLLFKRSVNKWYKME